MKKDNRVISGVRPVKFYVSVLPELDSDRFPDWSFFTVTVTWRGRERYAVYMWAWESNSLPRSANGLGEWDYEGSGEREDEAWLDRHRFSLDDALTIAEKLAPTVGIYSHWRNRFIQAQDILEETE